MSTDIEQLVLSKYIYQQGPEQLRNRSPYSAGLAVSLFQDAVEIMLWAVFKQVDADLRGKQPQFEQYWDIIREAKGNKERKSVPLKGKMIDLNKARVTFKHNGQLPRDEDVMRFAGYTEKFLSQSAKEFFEVEWQDVSLVSLIRDAPVREKMREAECFLEEEKYRKCIEQCAAAERLITDSLSQKLIAPVDSGLSSSIGRRGADIDFERTLRERFLYVERYLGLIRTLTIASLFHMNLSQYIQVQSIMPRVDRYASGKMEFKHKRHEDYSSDEAALCVRYVVEMALKVQHQIAWKDGPLDYRFRRRV